MAYTTKIKVKYNSKNTVTVYKLKNSNHFLHINLIPPTNIVMNIFNLSLLNNINTCRIPLVNFKMKVIAVSSLNPKTKSIQHSDKLDCSDCQLKDSQLAPKTIHLFHIQNRPSKVYLQTN
jgi:hypothetical protein